jgi:AraC-like DNA-binding protein
MNNGNPQVVSLIHKLPTTSKPMYGAFIIDLNFDEITDILRQINPASGGFSFILRQDGSRLTGLQLEDGKPVGEAMLEEKLRNSVLEQKEATGSFIFSEGKNDFAVSYGQFSPAGWIYVSVLPLKELTKPVSFISQTMIIMNLLGLTVAIILSWAASQRIYIPIRKLTTLFRSKARSDAPIPMENEDELEFIKSEWEYWIRESDTLQNKWKEHLPMLRENFLVQFLNGHLPPLTEGELVERYERLVKTASGQQFFFVLIHLSGMYAAERYFEGDEQLVSFAASNIVAELTEDRQVDILNFQDLTVGVLLSYSRDTGSNVIKLDVEEFSQQILHTLQEILKLAVTVILTKAVEHIEEIPDLLENSRQALLYRDGTQRAQVLDAMAVPEGKAYPFYPFLLEKEIVQHMRSGDTEGAIKGIESFIFELQQFDSKEIFLRQGLLQLLGSLLHLMAKSGYNNDGVYMDNNLFEQLMQIQESPQVVKWFEERILVPFSAFASKTSYSHESELLILIEQVTEALHANYEKSISLESVANDHNVTPYLLSKWFKKIKGINFIDYLTTIRIQKAKDLLLETDMKVNDIALKVGYQPSYFNRTFKKNEGMTPKAYKDKYKVN